MVSKVFNTANITESKKHKWIQQIQAILLSLLAIVIKGNLTIAVTQHAEFLWVSHLFLKMPSFYSNKGYLRDPSQTLSKCISTSSETISWTPMEAMWGLLLLWPAHAAAGSHATKALSSTHQSLRCRGSHLRATTTRACCWFIPSLLLQAPLFLNAPLTSTWRKSWDTPRFGFL